MEGQNQNSKELIPTIKEFVEDLDYDVANGMQKLRTKIGNSFWSFWTFVGYPYVWIAVALIFGLGFDLYHVLYVIIFASLSCLAVVLPIKFWVARRRPYDKHREIKPLKRERKRDYSFPSGHTYYATVNGVALALCYGGAYSLLLMLGLGIMVGISRLYYCVHYLSDVVVAYFLALGVAILIYQFFPLIMVLHYLT